MKWIFVEDGLPEIGKDVLCYYKIKEYEYFCIAHVFMVSETITKYSRSKYVEWKEGDDIVVPLCWCEIEPPTLI